jgi:hypothetical protein
VGADDHPFVSALHEDIRENRLAAPALSFNGSLFGVTALDHGNIVQHLYVHRSKFKGLEFIVAGFQIVQNGLLGYNFAIALEGYPIVGENLIELVDIRALDCICEVVFGLLKSVGNAPIVRRRLAGLGQNESNAYAGEQNHSYELFHL